jgi:hypothetical protein
MIHPEDAFGRVMLQNIEVIKHVSSLIGQRMQTPWYKWMLERGVIDSENERICNNARG